MDRPFCVLLFRSVSPGQARHTSTNNKWQNPSAWIRYLCSGTVDGRDAVVKLHGWIYACPRAKISDSGATRSLKSRRRSILLLKASLPGRADTHRGVTRIVSSDVSSTPRNQISHWISSSHPSGVPSHHLLRKCLPGPMVHLPSVCIANTQSGRCFIYETPRAVKSGYSLHH